jgi:hypothetical protein
MTYADRIAEYLEAWAESIERGITVVDGNEEARANQLRLAAKSVRAGDWRRSPPNPPTEVA